MSSSVISPAAQIALIAIKPLGVLLVHDCTCSYVSVLVNRVYECYSKRADLCADFRQHCGFLRESIETFRQVRGVVLPGSAD